MAKHKYKGRYATKDGKPVGNCLEASFELLTEFFTDLASLPPEARGMGNMGAPKWVHGLVWSEKTGLHCHAWVEDNMLCYDYSNGREAVMLKEDYYRLGRITEENVVRYDWLTGQRLLAAAGCYKFFDKKFKNYP